MPKMYRIKGGNSYTWVYVFAEREDGEPHPKDKDLATTEESWDKEDDAEDAVYQMQNALLKRGKEKPRRARQKGQKP
jgi:hypothetical protein